MPNQMPNYSVDRTLNKLNLNNLQILLIFPEFYELFVNFSQIFIRTFFFLLSCRTEISDLDNSESFPNYIWIIPESRNFEFAELNPNN